MKFFFLAAALICTFSLNTYAMGGSYSSSSGTMLGVLGGYRYNSMNTPGNGFDRMEKSTPAYQIGALLLIGISDAISLRFGAVYALRDMDFTTPKATGTFTGRAHLGYIDLPAMLQVTLFGSSFYTFFGQNTGVKISDTCDVGLSTGNCNGWAAAPFNITSIFGLGWNTFDLGSSGKFGFEIEYEYGMNNINPAFLTNTSAVLANAVLKFGI